MEFRTLPAGTVFFAALVALLVPVGLSAQSVEAEFSSERVAGVDVSYRVVGENLEVLLEAGTTGWIAVGFDPVMHMAGANMIIGYVEEGELFIADDYGTAAYGHDRDTNIGGSDDIIESEGSEAGGRTRIRFVIPLDSGDDKDKPLLPGEEYTVLVAHGRDGADNFSGYHANRGSFAITVPRAAPGE